MFDWRAKHTSNRETATVSRWFSQHFYLLYYAACFISCRRYVCTQACVCTYVIFIRCNRRTSNNKHKKRSQNNIQYTADKKLSYRRVTARCVLSVVILPITTQQCRNYLYDKSWLNWWYEVGGLVGGNVSWTMCTQLTRRIARHDATESAPIVSSVINKPTTVELCISPCLLYTSPSPRD